MIEKLHDRGHSAPASVLKGTPPDKPRPLAPAWLRRAAKAALGAVYPALCPLCRVETASGGGLCADCWRGATLIDGATCRSCGAPVAPGVGVGGGADGQVCDGCAHAPPAWSRGAAAVVYDGAGRRMILLLKHGDRLDIAPLAARWMLKAGAHLVAEADVIAPVPLHWRRLARRRYNQAGELAREVAAAAGRPDAAVLDLLRRIRRTPSMDGRNRGERLANVIDAFAVTSPEQVAGARILLIDDVMTTGATLSACAEALKAAGAADVNALVFARVARADWPS